MILNKLESYFNWRNALIPVSSSIRIRSVDAQRSIGYRDWYVFGVRVLRVQLMPR